MKSLSDKIEQFIKAVNDWERYRKSPDFVSHSKKENALMIHATNSFSQMRTTVIEKKPSESVREGIADVKGMLDAPVLSDLLGSMMECAKRLKLWHDTGLIHDGRIRRFDTQRDIARNTGRGVRTIRGYLKSGLLEQYANKTNRQYHIPETVINALRNRVDREIERGT